VMVFVLFVYFGIWYMYDVPVPVPVPVRASCIVHSVQYTIGPQRRTKATSYTVHGLHT